MRSSGRRPALSCREAPPDLVVSGRSMGLVTKSYANAPRKGWATFKRQLSYTVRSMHQDAQTPASQAKATFNLLAIVQAT